MYITSFVLAATCEWPFVQKVVHKNKENKVSQKKAKFMCAIDWFFLVTVFKAVFPSKFLKKSLSLIHYSMLLFEKGAEEAKGQETEGEG